MRVFATRETSQCVSAGDIVTGGHCEECDIVDSLVSVLMIQGVRDLVVRVLQVHVVMGELKKEKKRYKESCLFFSKHKE